MVNCGRASRPVLNVTMIELRLLGTLEIADPDRPEVEEVRSAPKRCALLAYLATAHEGEPCTRDELLALFWPDLDARRGRATLRQTLRLLRRELGREALTSGTDQVGLVGEHVWCDVTAFEEALDTGRTREALELYRGPFLDGFHFRGAGAPFEWWHERTAARLRDRAAQAARLLAERAERSGSMREAERWWRRLLAIRPYDESALRDLLTCLRSEGNRAEALRLYRAFRRRLASELEVEPSPETVGLVERLRGWSGTDPSATIETPAPADDRPLEGLEPASGPASDPSGPSARTDVEPETGDEPWYRRLYARLPRSALALALVLAGGWTGWWVTTGEDGEPERADVEKVVVLPFAYRGADSLAYLAEGMANLLSAGLDGVGGLRSVDAGPPARPGAKEPAPGPDPTAAAPQARRAGADLFVVGEVIELRGSLRVTAELHRSGDPGRALIRASAEEPVQKTFALVDRLAMTLLTGYDEVPGRLEWRAAAATESVPALKQYLRGEEHLRGGRYPAAIEAFERALAHDTAFALAYYRLAVAGEWAPRPDLMSDAIEAAALHSERLPRRYRELVEASLAWRRGDAEDAEARYRAILRRYPADLNARFQLGEVLFHYNPLRGRTVGESRDAWEQVVAADPDNREALLHLARVLAADSPPSEVVRHLPQIRLSGAAGDRRMLQIGGLQALALDDRAAQDRVLDVLERTSDAPWVDLWYVTAFSRNLPGSLRMLGSLVGEEKPVRLRAITHVMRAHLELGRGRWRSAGVELEAGISVDPDVGLPYRALLAVLPFSPAAPPELKEVRRELRAWRPEARPPYPDPRPAFTIHEGLGGVLKAYLLGTVAVRLGDREEVGRQLAVLESADGGGTARELAVDLARGLEAQAALAEGRPADALRSLERVAIRTTFERAFLSPFHARALERYLRGEALYRLGRDQEALRWYESAAQLSPYEMVYLAPSHLRRAQIQERVGRPAEARRHYTRFLELWDDADPELERYRREARRALNAPGPG